MTDQELARAMAGDKTAFAVLVEPFRGELHLHCYRMLGSVQDAEDALQETLVAAWRGLGTFEGRSSFRAWLYRIATNKSLNAMRAARSRPDATPAAHLPQPTRIGEPLWLEPYPDEAVDGLPDSAPGPEARYTAREATSLAFTAALQHLAPGQRAALILRDVLGFRAAEAASLLGCSVAAANSMLQRARAVVARELPPGYLEQAPLPGSARERELVATFTDAYERGDVGAVVALLTDDATLTMPPLPFIYQGRAAIAGFLGAICAIHRYRLIPVSANGQPSFGLYVCDDASGIGRAHGLLVVTLAKDGVSAITRFLDTGIMGRFGLPRML